MISSCGVMRKSDFRMGGHAEIRFLFSSAMTISRILKMYGNLSITALLLTHTGIYDFRMGRVSWGIMRKSDFRMGGHAEIGFLFSSAMTISRILKMYGNLSMTSLLLTHTGIYFFGDLTNASNFLKKSYL